MFVALGSRVPWPTCRSSDQVDFFDLPADFLAVFFDDGLAAFFAGFFAGFLADFSAAFVLAVSLMRVVRTVGGLVAVRSGGGFGEPVPVTSWIGLAPG